MSMNGRHDRRQLFPFGYSFHSASLPHGQGRAASRRFPPDPHSLSLLPLLA